MEPLNYSDYKKYLEQKNTNKKHIKGIETAIVELKEYSKANNFDFTNNKGFYEKNLAQNDKNIISTKEKVEELTNNYNSIKKVLNNRNFEKNPHAVAFLMKHNTIQTNPIKRFFNIKKDYKDINSSDRQRLLKILNNGHTVQINILNKNLENLKTENLHISKALNHITLNSQHTQFQNENYRIDLKITDIERPIKKLVENLIDLDFKNLQKTIKDNNIDIKVILLYISELLYNKLSSTDFKKENILYLEDNIRKIDLNTNTKNSIKI